MGTAIAATLEAVAAATALVHGVETAVAATQTAIAARNPTATHTPSPPPPRPPTPIPAAPPATLSTLRLAYAYGDVGRSDIEIYDVDEGNSWAVANQACDEAEPGWAPDGRTVVYQSDCPGNYDIYRVDVESGSTRQVTTTAQADEREPDISPDGNWIVYRSNGAGSDRNADGALYLMDLNGDGARALGLSGRAPDWSPSGRQLAYMSQVSGSWEIYVYDLDSGANRQLTSCAANCRFPAWSPDGRQVIYHTTTAAGNATPDSLWMIAAGGGSPVQLLGGDNPGRPSWSGSGLIAFNSNRGIEVVNEQGDRRRTVLNGNVHWAPDWSR
jgi:TolB protein